MSSVKKKIYALGSLLMVLVLVSTAVLSIPVLAQSDYPLQITDTEVANALDYLRGEQATDGSIGGFSASAWVTMAIAAAGEDPHDWKIGANPSLIDYLAANANNATSTTDYARMILAIEAAQENSTNFGGIDFIAQLKASYDGIQIGDESLVNDDFWGVMALISAGEDSGSDIIQNSLLFIKDCQQPDGGWGFDAIASWGTDVDSTAAAIMALIAAGESPNSTAVINGLAYIRANQSDNGGFLSWGATNADTNAWAISAIVAAGQDPTSADWTNNNNTPVDDLMGFQQGNGQFHWQDGTPGAWPCQTTAYAIQALLGNPYPVEGYITWWNCPLGEVALISPYPDNERSFLTVAADLSRVTWIGDGELLGVYQLDETTGDWIYFNPRFVTNPLTLLEPNEYYLVVVSDACYLGIPQII